MKRLALLPVLVLLLVAGCTDKSARRHPTSPRTGALARVQSGAKATTVCKSYLRERNAARVALEAKPANTVLQSKLTALNSMIADVCS